MAAPSPKCPQCSRPLPAPASNRYHPFCSDRCRLLDLGAWLDGRHAIPGEEPVPEPERPGTDDGS